MRKERLGEITPEAAKREGMDSGLKVFQFRELWVKLHGLWDPDQIVTVIDFEVVK